MTERRDIEERSRKRGNFTVIPEKYGYRRQEVIR
jgi:hypothetical protein